MAGTDAAYKRDAAASARPSVPPGSSGAGLSILAVDDDAGALGALATLFRSDGFTVATAPDGPAALAEARRALPDAVITDLHMDPMTGLELCDRLHELDPDLPVVVLTAFSEVETAIASLRAGAADYLTKPLSYENVRWCVERAIARRAAKLEQDRLRRHNEALQRALNERLVISSIREQEHAEVQARQRAQLSALLENLSEGVIIAEPGGRLVLANDAARAVVGLGAADPFTTAALDGLEVRDLEGRPCPPEQRPLARARRGERYVDHEIVLVLPSAEVRRVVATGTSVRDEAGDVVLAIVLLRDVTELRRLEALRGEYLALVSHDLRSPLQSIQMCIAALGLMLAKRGADEGARLAERGAQNVKRMTSMLEDLTEATHLEAGGVVLRREACDIARLVAGVVAGLDDARARRIALAVDVAPADRVLADAPRLERVVTNLLTNALKYSAAGAPVEARLTRRAGDVTLAVTDHGIGIAPEDRARLFHRYHRTAAGSAHAGGLGLGLYIARLIAEAHGGRIDVASEVGVGSTFTLVIPAQQD